MADPTRRIGIYPQLSRRAVLAGSLAATASGVLATHAWGQAKKKEEFPEPEVVTLGTKDGVQLKATYYGGTLKKKAVPVLMVHGWNGQQDEYRIIARALQQTGHAMLTVDLRGHGLSTRQRLPDGEKELDPEKMRAADLERMVLDLEACKKFLVEKNNAGELNVAALCVVAAEFGCIVALKWAVMDWSAARLPAFKQGQDVQALALLSPVESFKGVTARSAITSQLLRGKPISKMICVGAGDSKALAEARRLHNTLERFHGKPPPTDEAADKQDLFFITADTELQGTKLLDLRAFNVGRDLAKFINLRLVAKMDNFPWEERKNPLGD